MMNVELSEREIKDLLSTIAYRMRKHKRWHDSADLRENHERLGDLRGKLIGVLVANRGVAEVETVEGPPEGVTEVFVDGAPDSVAYVVRSGPTKQPFFDPADFDDTEEDQSWL